MAGQITSLLAPYLMKPINIVYKEVAKTTGAKVTEAAWNKSRSLWNNILSVVEKNNPENAKSLKELAETPDDFNSDALSWNLVKILKAMSPEELDEIWNIVYNCRTEPGVEISSHNKNVINKSKFGAIGNFRVGDNVYNIQTSKNISIEEIDNVMNIGDALIRDRAFAEAANEYESLLKTIPQNDFPNKYIKITNSLGIAYWCLASEKKDSYSYYS